ncbi:hypothetical protein ACFLWX_00895 [Chloroflexota bacterium]
MGSDVEVGDAGLGDGSELSGVVIVEEGSVVLGEEVGVAVKQAVNNSAENTIGRDTHFILMVHYSSLIVVA